MKLHRVKGKNWQAEKNPQRVIANTNKKSGGVEIQLLLLLYQRIPDLI